MNNEYSHFGDDEEDNQEETWRESIVFKKKTIREELAEHNEKAVFWDPDYLDQAIIGISTEGRVIYDYNKLADIFVTEEGMTLEDAYEHLGYNLEGMVPYIKEYPPVQVHILRRPNEKDNGVPMAVCNGKET